MIHSKIIIFILILVLFFAGFIRWSQRQPASNINISSTQKLTGTSIANNPLSIEFMRKANYPGRALTIEQSLADGSNYHQYIASYLSENLKIYGLLTVPIGTKPVKGWPVIIFNHGYLQPDTYVTNQRYVAYVDGFARNGYIVFKSDYRGHGKSQGTPEGAYYSSGYSIDVLNVVATLKQYPDADSNNIGMWGHSMGGNITVRDIVVRNNDIKAVVIWGGVVGSYDDLMNNWERKVSFHPSGTDLRLRNNNRQNLVNEFGTPQANPDFWNTIDPTAHLSDINTPIQLHTGGNDEEVPPAFSQSLFDKLQALGKTAEYYNYPGGDHNISSPNFNLAMQRSIKFFDKYLKP